MKKRCSKAGKPECASMDCNISSIAEPCLTIPSRESHLAAAKEYISVTKSAVNWNGDHVSHTKEWLRKMFNNGFNVTSLLTPLANKGIRCIIENMDGGTKPTITCVMAQPTNE